jgi:transposase InsO family protein
MLTVREVRRIRGHSYLYESHFVWDKIRKRSRRAWSRYLGPCDAKGRLRAQSNGLQESFHGHLKMDYLWIREPESFWETRARLAESIRNNNEERPHSSLGYLTPREFAERNTAP